MRLSGTEITRIATARKLATNFDNINEFKRRCCFQIFIRSEAVYGDPRLGPWMVDPVLGFNRSVLGGASKLSRFGWLDPTTGVGVVGLIATLDVSCVYTVQSRSIVHVVLRRWDLKEKFQAPS